MKQVQKYQQGNYFQQLNQRLDKTIADSQKKISGYKKRRLRRPDVRTRTSTTPVRKGSGGIGGVGGEDSVFPSRKGVSTLDIDQRWVVGFGTYQRPRKIKVRSSTPAFMPASARLYNASHTDVYEDQDPKDVRKAANKIYIME